MGHVSYHSPVLVLDAVWWRRHGLFGSSSRVSDVAFWMLLEGLFARLRAEEVEVVVVAGLGHRLRAVDDGAAYRIGEEWHDRYALRASRDRMVT